MELRSIASCLPKRGTIGGVTGGETVSRRVISRLVSPGPCGWESRRRIAKLQPTRHRTKEFRNSPNSRMPGVRDRRLGSRTSAVRLAGYSLRFQGEVGVAVGAGGNHGFIVLI